MTPAETFHLTQSLLTKPEIPKTGVLSHTLHNDEAVKMVVFGFASGEELKAHTAPMPATIQILEGEAAITLGTEFVNASAGCLIHMQPGLLHGIVAKSPMRMLLTLVKAGRVDAKSPPE